MKVVKIIVAVVLVVACAAGVFIGWAKGAEAPPSASNPFGISTVNALDTWLENPDNKTLFDSKTDSINGWGDESKNQPRTLDYYSILQQVAFPTPWEQNTNAYYNNSSILGQKITVYAPSAVAFADGVTATTPFEVNVPATQEALDALSDEDRITLAVALYYHANAKYINAPCAGYSSKSYTDNLAVGMHNRVNLDILQINNNGEMYRADYRWNGGIDIFGLIPEETANAMLELTCAERRYANKNMTATYNTDGSIATYGTFYDKSNNCKVPVPAEGATELTAEEIAAGMAIGIPYTDWSQKSPKYINSSVYFPSAFTDKSSDLNAFTVKMNSKDKPEVYTDQNYTLYAYHKCAYNVETTTLGSQKTTVKSIPELKIVEDANGNKIIRFSIELNIREKRTAEDLLYTIREGAGDNKANYTGIVAKFDIWENGMYRLYGEDMKWKASVFGFQLSSDFLYGDIYFYGAADCDITKYVNETVWPEAAVLKAAYSA